MSWRPTQTLTQVVPFLFSKESFHAAPLDTLFSALRSCAGLLLSNVNHVTITLKPLHLLDINPTVMQIKQQPSEAPYGLFRFVSAGTPCCEAKRVRSPPEVARFPRFRDSLWGALIRKNLISSGLQQRASWLLGTPTWLCKNCGK